MRYATLLLSLIIAGGLHAQNKSFVKDAQKVELNSLAAIPKSFFGKTVKFSLYNRGKEGYLDSDVKKALPESAFYHFDTSVNYSQRRTFTVVAELRDKELISKITGMQIGSYIEVIGKVGYHKSRKVYFVAVKDVSQQGSIADASKKPEKAKLHEYKHVTAEEMIFNRDKLMGQTLAVKFRYGHHGLLENYGRYLRVKEQDYMLLYNLDYSTSSSTVMAIIRRNEDNNATLKGIKPGKPYVLVGNLISVPYGSSGRPKYGLFGEFAYPEKEYHKEVKRLKAEGPVNTEVAAEDNKDNGEPTSTTAKTEGSVNDVISESITNYYDTAIMGKTLSHALHPSRIDKIKRTYANKNPYRIWALSEHGKEVKQYKVFRVVAISEETQMVVGRLYFKDHTSRLVTNMMKKDPHGAWKIWE